MQTQFLYTTGDNPQVAPSTFQDLSDFSKSTASSSGYYTYLDEGIATYNDNDHIYISGMYQVSGYTNPAGRNYLTFDINDLQVKPSSVLLSVRCLYMPDTESGTVDMIAYLCNSGRFYTSTSISGMDFWTGLRSEAILASSIFTVTSGAAFTTHNMNMLINNLGVENTNKYHDCTLSLGYLYSPSHNSGQLAQHGTLKISAIEAIASGEYFSNKYLPIQLCGGDLQVHTDHIHIYHDFGTVGAGNNFVYQKLHPGDEHLSITNEYAYDVLDRQSPVLCLNSGDIVRSDIFSDCFFNFAQKPTTSNNIDFTSSKSSHKFNLSSNIQIPASSAWYTGRSYSPTGNDVSQNGHYINKDSFIVFEPYLTGIASGCFPSGDFSMWVGASQLPVSPNTTINFVRSNDGDFTFGITGTNRLFATLLSSSGTYNTTTAIINNQELGAIVTYDSGGLGLYKMDVNGSIVRISQTDSFTRQTRTQPSGDLTFSLPTTFNAAENLNLTLYEFGIINSGMNNSNVYLLDRKGLFDSIRSNTLASISSGIHHITYKSLQDRVNYSGYDYSGQFYNFGKYSIAPTNYSFLTPSDYDNDMYNIAIQNKYGVPYVDISENCFLSGTTSLFFQDGSLYFSGWIDASTTNPSGFLENNFFVRALQDKSVIYDIPNTYYDFGEGGYIYQTSSVIPTSFASVPIADGNRDSFFQYSRSANSTSGLYTYLDEYSSAANDGDWVSMSGASTGSGYIGFRFGDAGISNFQSGLVSFRAFADALGHKWDCVYLLNGSGSYPFSNVVASSVSISTYDIRTLGTFRAVLTPNTPYRYTNLNDAYIYFTYYQETPSPGVAIFFTSADISLSGYNTTYSTVNSQSASSSITTNYLANLVPTNDAYFTSYGLTRTKSGGGGEPYYTSVDELRTAYNDADYVGLSGTTPDSGVLGFPLGEISNFSPSSCVVFYRAGTAYTLGANQLFNIQNIYITSGSGTYPFATSSIIASSLSNVNGFNTAFTNHSSILRMNASGPSYTNPHVYFICEYTHALGGTTVNEGRFAGINVELSGSQTSVVYGVQQERYSGYYTHMTEAIGKVAAGTTTLRSGLNEYIFPLEKSLYRFDLYTDVNGVNSPHAINYDKTTIEHPTWDGGDVSLYYASRNDVLNSGYYDTLKIYTATILTESWSDPPPSINSGLNLYTNGMITLTSGLDLYLCSNFAMSGLDLLTYSTGYTSGVTTLFIEGGLAKSGMNLMIGNYQSGTNNYIPLYTITNPYPSSTNLTNLYINSSTYSSIINSFDMVIQNSGYGVMVPLFLKVLDDEENSDQITLVVYNDTTASKGIDFFLSQNNSSIFDTQKLFIAGNGLYEGSLIAKSGHTLTIGSGPDPYYGILPMTINGPSGANNIVYISMSGGTYTTKSLDLVIGSSTGYLNNDVSLYSHGF